MKEKSSTHCWIAHRAFRTHTLLIPHLKNIAKLKRYTQQWQQLITFMKEVTEFTISLYSRKETTNMAKVYTSHVEKQQRAKVYCILQYKYYLHQMKLPCARFRNQKGDLQTLYHWMLWMVIVCLHTSMNSWKDWCISSREIHWKLLNKKKNHRCVRKTLDHRLVDSKRVFRPVIVLFRNATVKSFRRLGDAGIDGHHSRIDGP